MTDLDFEELDRAVNSAMTGNSEEKKPDEVKNNNIDIKLDTKNDVDSDSKNERKIENPSQRKVNNSVFKSRQPVRSSGRFMDVVHPSSDMRPSSLKKTDKRADSEPQDAKKITEESEKSNLHNMPDPIEMHEKMENIDEDNKKPSDSPFLPNAKVEKRPLGAFSTATAIDDTKQKIEPEESTKLAEETSIDTKNDKNEIEKADTDLKDEAPYEPNSENRNVHLPPELQKDILDIESDPTTDKLSPEGQRSNQPTPLGSPYLRSAQSELTPQYKEKSSEEKTSGSIYDTKEYHSPLAHPAKKKSGWMTVVWIVLIVVAAVGVAYIVSTYLFVK